MIARPDYAAWMKTHFRFVSDLLLASVDAGEDLVLNLEAEQSLFLRFNANKVRQNTWIEQAGLALKLQKDRRTATVKITLSGDRVVDEARAREALIELRAEIPQLPVDENQVAVVDNGRSDQTHRGTLLGDDTIIDAICGAAEGTDMAGFYCAGPIISANRNSKGQDHWFAAENFFMDYSLYDGAKAVKGCYAGTEWNGSAWQAALAQSKNQLSLLSRPVRDVPPGEYRAYLAPAAIAELLQTMSWGGFSYSQYRRGQSPLKKMVDENQRLSVKFTARENFDLGLSPVFNGLGEVSASRLTLIEDGKLVNWMVSSRAAVEYSTASNHAAESEGPRSLEVLAGSLTQTDVLKKLGTGLYLSNLHYVNWSDPQSARMTGMTRYACFWVENGEIVAPIKDLRFDVSLYDIWGGKLVEVTEFSEVSPSTWTYEKRSLGGMKTPGMIVEGMKFTL